MHNDTKETEFRLKIYPKEFEKVREFYEKTLGYRVAKEWNRGEDDLGVMFDTGTAVIELLSPVDLGVPVSGVDVSLHVEDSKKLWERLKNEVEVVKELHHTDWGDTAFTISDPEGFEITYFTKD
jgi:catechol 2,3-dioxygenase-like lactoylglutathione lyase family enzyme